MELLRVEMLSTGLYKAVILIPADGQGDQEDFKELIVRGKEKISQEGARSLPARRQKKTPPKRRCWQQRYNSIPDSSPKLLQGGLHFLETLAERIEDDHYIDITRFQIKLFPS